MVVRLFKEIVNDNPFKFLTCPCNKSTYDIGAIFSMQSKPVQFNNILKYLTDQPIFTKVSTRNGETNLLSDLLSEFINRKVFYKWNHKHFPTNKKRKKNGAF